MGVVRLWVGAELRRRWRVQVVLALLIGVVGTVILTVSAGARTTASAYDRFIQRQAIPTAEMDSVPGEARAAIGFLPAVKVASAYSVAFAAPAREGVVPGQDAVVFAGIDPAYGHALDRPIVLSGRLPSYPLWLAGFLAALGLLAVVHALLVSARRRDHQVGVLRALGMTRRQVVGAVSAQGATMCILGVVIGVPLGVSLGRWTWSLSAHQLGVGEGAVVPGAVLAIVLGGGLGLLLALGASAGWFAGRATPSSALRVP